MQASVSGILGREVAITQKQKGLPQVFVDAWPLERKIFSSISIFCHAVKGFKLDGPYQKYRSRNSSTGPAYRLSCVWGKAPTVLFDYSRLEECPQSPMGRSGLRACAPRFGCKSDLRSSSSPSSKL